MKLIEALEILRQEQPANVQSFSVCVVSGFNPLHLQTFLSARLRLLFTERRVQMLTGLYGDFWGNLERIAGVDADIGVVLLEWADIDPRLGLRSLGSWAPGTFADVLNNAKMRATQFLRLIRARSKKMQLVICFPTLPIPPLASPPGWQASSFDLALRACVGTLSAQVARYPNVRVVNSERLGRLSEQGNRLDVRSELLSGFPYRLPHASAVAKMLSYLIRPPMPKKGLITDLDGTLWGGILGEVGLEGVSWDLEHHTHMHGVYQRQLHSLSEAGILLGAASKNDGQIVENALQRKDLLLSHDAIFPIEAHWDAKSESVSRILKTWNVLADSVVFIDDSPMELAEVKAVHPEMTCILFPKDDPQAIEALLYQLRDLFGKDTFSEEDSIRRESIRRPRGEEVSRSRAETTDDFLKQAEAELVVSYCKSPLDPRALELVNKTNQFNLNGKRHTEHSWQDYIRRSDTVFMLVSYRDKYGPLGKIAVLAGRKTQRRIVLDVWVMSCRAFSRRIEHRCLQELFERYDVDEIESDFQSTPKNKPIQEFLTDVLGESPKPQCLLSRDQFMERSAETFQRVLELANG